MGWSLLGRAEPQLWLEMAQGTKLTDGLIALTEDTIVALSLLRSFQFPAMSAPEPS